MGATTNYGHVTPLVLNSSGTSPTNVTCVLTGLVLHSYHYRVVATNGLIFGGDIFIPMQLAPPQVATSQPRDVTSTSATLRGTANPMERETIAWLEYGLTTKYGTASLPVDVGGGSSPVEITHAISGLLPWMTYHCRAVASNSVGRTDGPDVAFTLPGPSMTAPSLSAVPDVPLKQGGSTQVWFTAQPAGVGVRVQCNNPVLLPANGLVLSGSGNARTLSLTPDPGHSGAAQVTVTASDGTRSTNRTFTLTVAPRLEDPRLTLTNVHAVSAEAWRFRLADAGTGATNYLVEFGPDLSSNGVWIAATNVSAVGGGWYEVINGPPQPALGFYRVKGFRLLTGGLNATDLTVEEGTVSAGLVIVFNGPYVGPLSFTWTGSWGTTNGTVQVNGTTAVIPIPPSFLADNPGLGQLQTLTLRLGTGAGHALTGAAQGHVLIEENDADWQGVLSISNGLAGATTATLTNGAGNYTTVALSQNPSSMVSFTLRIQQVSGNLQGQIQSDSYGFFPTNALAQLTLTENSFTAVATNVPLPALTGSPLFSGTHRLDLRLDAANAAGETNVSATRIRGAATLVSAVPGRPYLDSAVAGTFWLSKPPAIPSTNEVPLYPAP